MLWTGWQRFRYWRSEIDFVAAYYKLKKESSDKG
ncbi:hypothetical protein NB714_000956 [Pantoea dispersa]|nr:hypothetical protein [Pantoea dispersa]MCW0324831.1 hypothetical protein [Pantoea dispersa]MCW0431441.1 hypothetical protein [Pantoea dispersa]